MAEARKFYGEILGLDSPWNWGDDAIGFNIGDITLIVEPDDGSHEDEKLSGRFVGCTIQVDDIDATYRDWTAKGVEFDGPPEDVGFGVMTSFRDRAGNVFTLFASSASKTIKKKKLRRKIAKKRKAAAGSD